MWSPVRRILNPNRLQGRLLVTYLLLVLLALGSLVGWAGYQLQSSTVGQAQRDLEVDALRLAAGVRDLSPDSPDSPEADPALSRLLEGYARSFDGAVAVLDTNFQFVATSEFDEEDDEGSEEEEGEELALFSAEMGNLDPAGLAVGSWRSGGRLFAAAPVLSSGGESQGLLLVSVPAERTSAAVARNWAVLLTAGGAILLATAVATVVVARQVAGPVENVTLVSEAMAGGDLGRRVEPKGPEEVKRLGRAFNEMADKVEDMLARQRAFAADAAHELRSPLTSLKLRVEMLQKHGEKDAEFRRTYVARLEQEIERLQELGEHLLAISRMDSGESFQMAPLDIAPLLREVAQDMTPLFGAAGLTFDSHVPSHLPAITGDAEALRIAVRNLLDNAIQYTPAQGRVSLRARAEEGGILVAISDSGQGIPPEHLDRVFERFYRVDKARSRRQGGSGLGLSLVHSVAQAHGGRVGVTSTVGEGSTFTMFLPGDHLTRHRGRAQGGDA